MNILRDYINANYERTQHDNAGALHPSTLGDCNRSAVFSYLGLEKDVEHSQFLKRIFHRGHQVEKDINDALKAKGVLIASSVPVLAEVDGVAVKGEVDHLIKWQDGWRIADTKSVSDFALKRYGHELPYRHHALQVGAYEWMLRQMLSKDDDSLSKSPTDWLRYLEGKGYGDRRNLAVALSRIQIGAEGEQYPPILLYVGRGNLEEQMVEVGPQAEERALDKMKGIARHINEGTIPERAFLTPNDHRYLCARTIRKGGYKRKGKTGRAAYKEGNEPVYVPSCSWFKICWKVLPVEWSFWSEVKSNADRCL